MHTGTLPPASTQPLPITATTRTLLPLTYILLFLMGVSFFLLDAILPLQNLWFYNALLTLPLRSWLLFPMHLLLPGRLSVSSLPGVHHTFPGSFASPWRETWLLFAIFLLLFSCFLLALHTLPRTLTHRFILVSTFLLGTLCILFPIVSSEDIFSYIAYARMLLLYHLNPLATLPTVIHTDQIYQYLYWTNQPSIYGPTWIVLTTALQWLDQRMGITHIASMVLLLRLFSLAMHLASVQLVWSIIGSLPARNPLSTTYQQLRRRATLAFAWNPFLLYEACVNAHVDTTMLFFVLLMLWVLLTRRRHLFTGTALTAVLLAIATCIKFTLLMFLPGLLIFLWVYHAPHLFLHKERSPADSPGGNLTHLYYTMRSMQQTRRLIHMGVALGAYCSAVILLYAPFWQGGAVLHVLQVNPGTFHATNSPYAFLIALSVSIRGSQVLPSIVSKSSHIEWLAHLISMALFCASYCVLFVWMALTIRRAEAFQALVRWMLFVWLVYCLFGSPWFWPWYMTTFFGLFALVESDEHTFTSLARFINVPLAVRLLTLSILSMYCFLSFAPLNTPTPFLKHFVWTYLGGLWVWGLPLLALHFPRRKMTSIAVPFDIK